jgi:hypothetical protein
VDTFVAIVKVAGCAISLPLPAKLNVASENVQVAYWVTLST